MKVEIRLCGFGGQGLILASKLLSQAAIIDGKIATQYQTYGAQVRGGTVKGDVVISERKIDHPTVIAPDILVAMSQDAYKKYGNNIKEGGIIITDPYFVKNIGRKHMEIPFYETIKEELHSTLPLNMMVIAFIAKYTGLVSEASVEKAVLDRVPPHTIEINSKALKLGVKFGEKYRQKN